MSARQPKMYTAKAQFVLRNSDSSPNSTSPEAIATEVKVVQSAAVANLVRQKLPNAPSVDAAAIVNTSLVEVTAKSQSASLAAKAANAYIDGYIQYRHDQDSRGITSSRAQITSQIADLATQITDTNRAIQNRRADVLRRYATPPSETDAARIDREQLQSNELASIDRDLGSRLSAYTTQQVLLEQRLRDLEAQANNGIDQAQLVTAAAPPSAPTSPKPVRDGMLALGAGLMLGVAAAFVVEYLDDSIKGRDDFEAAVGPALPVLGVVPSVRDWRRKRRLQVASNNMSMAPTVEAYRSLGASVQFMTVEQGIDSLLVTSPVPGEGKSTTITNLAMVLARAGRKVIVVDADLRRPTLHYTLGRNNDTGLTTVMRDGLDPLKLLVRVPDVDNLRFMSAGPDLPYSSELLSSPKFAAVLDRLRSDGSIVLVDAPPVLAVADASAMAGAVGAVILVVSVGMSTRKQTLAAVERLRHMKAPILGAVINRARPNDMPEHGYYGVPQENRNSNSKPRELHNPVVRYFDRSSRRSSEIDS